MVVTCGRECKFRNSNGACRSDKIMLDQNGVCGKYEKKKIQVFREDNVVIFDNAGIPSIMVRYIRNKDAEKVHPMFKIGGDIYDEIYISKYKNCVYNGRAYSLPFQKPKTNVTLEEAEEFCRAKGEGWHLMTAMEREYIANDSYKNNTLPHGNTDYGKYHADPEETCDLFNGYQGLTGTGPATWFSDHTVFGVDGLCGDTWEWVRGLRLNDGRLEVAKENDAADMSVDLTKESHVWEAVKSNGDPVYIDTTDDRIRFTTEKLEETDCTGSQWGDVVFDCGISEQMDDLAMFTAEPKAYIYADSEGERLPICGGSWAYGASAGVFGVFLSGPRPNSCSSIGFRSAFYRKTDNR